MTTELSKHQAVYRSLRPELGKLSLILIVFVLMTLAFSLVLPLGEASDEEEHFGLIRFIAEQGRPPLTRTEQVSISSKGDASPVYHALVALLTQHVDISDLPDLPDPRHELKRAIPDDRLPFKGLYHTEDEAWPWRGIVLAWHWARLVSIPLGAITILVLYLTVRAIYPRRHFFALAATVFAAFIPRFVMNSSIVSDDNLVIPLIAFALYLMVRIAQGDRHDRTIIILGVLTGLAAISKYHSLLLLPEMTLLLLALAWMNPGDWRLWLRRWGLAMLAFLLTAGWWFGYLLVQFNQIAELGWLRGLIAPLGDPVITGGVGRALNQQSDVQLGYEAPLGWLEWIGLLFQSFWFRYGRGHVIDSPVIIWALALLILLAIVGLAVRLWHTRWQDWRLDIALLALHLLLYLILLVTRYMSLPTRETAQGRHLYPSLIAIALFLVLGWHELGLKFSRRWSPTAIDRAVAVGAGVLMIGFSAITLPLFILPVYYPYLPITTADPANAPIQHRQESTLAQGLDLLGYTLDSPAIAAGEALPLTLYWQATARIDRDYLVQICLLDASGQPVCHWRHPVNGRYPTRAWEKGYLIRDQVYLPSPNCLPSGEYEIVLAVQLLRPDTATTAIAEIARHEPLSLGKVALTKSYASRQSDLEVWVGNKRYDQGEIQMEQIRQAMTLIDYKTAANEVVTLNDSSGTNSWTQITPPMLYNCPDGTIAAIHNFIVDPGVRPGAYAPLVDGQSQKNLRLLVSTRPRTYQPPAGLSIPLNASFGEQVELLGYRLDLSPRWPGQTIEIEVSWRSLTTMEQRFVGSFHLLDDAMKMWGQIDHILGNDFEYPNVLWAPGEVVSQVFTLPIDGRTPAGRYTIEFGVYDNSTGDFQFLPITLPDKSEPVKQLHLGPVRVLDPAQTRSPDHPLQVELGGQIELLGYDLAPQRLTVSEPLALALHWQAIGPPQQDYTVFTQLIGPDGRVWAQQDNPPQGGRYPTTGWAVNDQVVDRYELHLKKDAPPGEYRLLVGMYEPATGQRLPAIDTNDQPLPDNAIPLTTLTVN